MIERTPKRRFGRRWFFPNVWDARELFQRLLLLPAVVAPRPLGMALCRVVAAALLRRGSWLESSLLLKVPATLAAAAAMDQPAFARRLETLILYERVLVLRGVVFGGWHRKLIVEGLEHVHEGLAAGSGVILWVFPCVGNSVAAKQAIFQAGIPLAHLSRPGHGFSSSPFGVTLVSPILRRAETKYLAERVVIDDQHTIAPLRRLRVLLQANRVVSISVTKGAGRSDRIQVLGSEIQLPRGPIELAAATGARILPVYTAQRETKTRVIIGGPLPVAGPGAPAIHAAQQALVSWLDERIREDPTTWLGWRILGPG